MKSSSQQREFYNFGFTPGCRFNAGSRQASPTSNTLTVNGPTERRSGVNGQVLTSDGQQLAVRSYSG